MQADVHRTLTVEDGERLLADGSGNLRYRRDDDSVGSVGDGRCVDGRERRHREAVDNLAKLWRQVEEAEGSRLVRCWSLICRHG